MNKLNNIYLRRRNRLVLETNNAYDTTPMLYVATMVKNLETLGYTFSERLMRECTRFTLPELTAFNSWILAAVKQAKGAHRVHKPMYPNFPSQVMEMSELELYVNAIFHYWTDGKWTPPSEVKERFPLVDITQFTQIDLGSDVDRFALFTQLASANVAWGAQDKEDVEEFVVVYGDNLLAHIPSNVPQKENAAALSQMLLAITTNAADLVGKFCHTATDILRLAVAMSGGDVSLAVKPRFKNFKRAERVFLLELLNAVQNPVEDMLRWKGYWLRLGEKLHVGEYAKRFPNAVDAFSKLRNNEKVETFNSVVEQALRYHNADTLMKTLTGRAGDFARRLDHVLRNNKSQQEAIVASFKTVANKVSTPVLLQVMTHFKHRNTPTRLRTFFPKGNVTKAKAIENNLASIPQSVCQSVVAVCENALIERFRALPDLGNVYLDDKLANYGVPFALRSSSKSLRTLVRGSRVPLDEKCKTLRFFCWWKNGSDRTDIDLSASMFDENFQFQSSVAYYNLKEFGGCHSGDIVDAPNGASEFIDIDIDKVRAKGTRYIVMTLNSYSRQPFCDLPECFAGWMSRQYADSGEIYEPKTVADRVDIAADTQIAIPLIIDVVDRVVIWCDMALKRHPSFQNNVRNNLSGINVTLESFATMKKPNLYDLLKLHAKARGNIVESVEQANTVFSVANDTPYKLEEISSEYMV